ncbi:MAG: ABC transporter ATP-binding protein [Hespellia sp.]|nr:ABC transporter ATP-binding protein [Hespellia sp.]
MEEPIIEVNHVSMEFNLSAEKIDSMKEYFVKRLKNQISYNSFWALNDINFTMKKGEAIALIGLNGCGKSTLLKTIAGVYKPTKGQVTVRGSMAPLIELGAGFDMDLTAEENIYLNGAILGYSRAEMERYYDDIVEFSELHDFMNVPIKNFSSGMLARLAFAIATIGKPDILICDEVLSVGDFRFQEKCEKRIQKMLEGDTSLLFVSHSIQQVQKICDRAIWIEKGHVVEDGPTSVVCPKYNQAYQPE